MWIDYSSKIARFLDNLFYILGVCDCSGCPSATIVQLLKLFNKCKMLTQAYYYSTNKNSLWVWYIWPQESALGNGYAHPCKLNLNSFPYFSHKYIMEFKIG